MLVFNRLCELVFDVTDHTFLANRTFGTARDDAVQVNNHDFVARVRVTLDEMFFVGCATRLQAGLAPGGDNQGKQHEVGEYAHQQEKSDDDRVNDPACTFYWLWIGDRRCSVHDGLECRRVPTPASAKSAVLFHLVGAAKLLRLWRSCYWSSTITTASRTTSCSTSAS